MNIQDNPFNQVEAEKTFQGRKQFQSKYKEDQFQEFMQWISEPDEWKQWRVFVEGQHVTSIDDLNNSMAALKPGNVVVVDQPNKHLQFMNKETYELNLD